MSRRPASTTRPKPAAKPKPDQKETGERLHVRIAHSGLCSRRAAEKLIQEARVIVNGEIITDLGVKVDADDEVRVDGQIIGVAKTYTVLLNKPQGVVTTMSDPQGRPTIVKLLPKYGVQLKPVGRLDMETEGLLICTNDGELANRLAHPSYGIEKEYQATVTGVPDEQDIAKLRKGVFVEGRKTAPAKVEFLHGDRSGETSTLRMTIHEGRKRQVRLMFESIDHPVRALKRSRIGPLLVKGMHPGECRLLGKAEVNELRRMVGLEPT